MPKDIILVTPRSVRKDLLLPLRESNFELRINETGRTLALEDLKKLAVEPSRVVGVLAGLEHWGEKEFVEFSSIRVLSRLGVGIDAIDLGAARGRGVVVHGTMESVSRPVAEHTLALALSLLRKIPEQNESVHARSWSRAEGTSLAGLKVGVVGLGKIGSEVAKLFARLDALVGGFDPALSSDTIQRRRRFPHVTWLDFDDLIDWADLVTLHVPSVSSTRGLIGPAELTRLRGKFLINTSRPEVLDEGALLHALKSEELSGVALDVLSTEPYFGELLGLPNLILTPHVATFTSQARRQMTSEAVRNLLEELS